jgi:hypothetical protein
MQKGKPEVAVFPRAHQDVVIPAKAGIHFFQCNNIINQWISAFTEMTIKVLPEGFCPLLQKPPPFAHAILWIVTDFIPDEVGAGSKSGRTGD